MTRHLSPLDVAMAVLCTIVVAVTICVATAPSADQRPAATLEPTLTATVTAVLPTAEPTITSYVVVKAPTATYQDVPTAEPTMTRNPADWNTPVPTSTKPPMPAQVPKRSP